MMKKNKKSYNLLFSIEDKVSSTLIFLALLKIILINSTAATAAITATTYKVIFKNRFTVIFFWGLTLCTSSIKLPFDGHYTI